MLEPQLTAYRPTIAEVNVDAFHHNINLFKTLAQDILLLAVIKTNAYGHGVLRIGQEAIKAGADRLAVTTVEEGAYLRVNGITCPVHLLCSVPLEQVCDVVAYDLTPSISTERFAKKLNEEAVKARKVIPIHVKIDVGLHRFGMAPEETIPFFQSCSGLKGISIEGVYTHFSEADEANWGLTEWQFSLFRHTVRDLEEAGFAVPIKHVGASTIALERADMYCDMIRPGIGLFGYPPDKRQEHILPLKPVLELKTKVIRVRDLPVNSRVGYGNGFAADRKTKVAVVPIGHGDGYSRALSNKGEVLIRGKRAPVIGTISLDQTFVDVTDIPNVTEGDDVVLIGKQADDEITARDVAAWMDSIVDEVLASILERVKRVYV